MIDKRLAVGCAVVLLVALPSAEQVAQPRFTVAVDLVRLDVTVLGRDRKPVTGLTAADFTVLENGKPRPVHAFSSVDLPPAPLPSDGPARWLSEVQPDVVSNQVSPARIVVLLIDDYSVMSGGTATGGTWAVDKVRKTVQSLIDGLDPTDLAAVLFTADNRAAQSLTLDRRRLRSAIDRSAIFPGSRLDDEPDDEGDSASASTLALAEQAQLCPYCALRALRHVTEALQAFPDRRKEVIFISRGFSLVDSESVRIFTEAMQFAQAANIAIHPMDPAGLLTYATTAQSSARTPPAFVGTIKGGTQALRTISDHTGTRAVVNTNDPDTAVTRILDESRHYYLLAFVPADLTPNGKKRHIEVKVNRKGVNVRARNGYYPPVPATVAASTKPPAERAIDSPLPQAGIPLTVSLTAVAGTAGPEVAAVLGVNRMPQPDGMPARTEDVEVVAQVLDQYGRKRGIERRTVRLPPGGAAAGDYYELLSRLPAKPGRYEVRLGVSTASQTGSVYGYVDVPDFAHAPLAVSGWAIAATPGTVHAPAGVFGPVMPIIPTSRRTFSVGDSVQGWLRIHQQATSRAVPLTIEVTVLDRNGAVRITDRRTLAPETFAGGASADYLCPVPLTYGPGEYLLDATIRGGTFSERRSVRYTVQ